MVEPAAVPVAEVVAVPVVEASDWLAVAADCDADDAEAADETDEADEEAAGSVMLAQRSCHRPAGSRGKMAENIG